MKKLSIFLLALFASAGITQAAIYDGSCGDNLTWSLNTIDSTLTITGSGEMTSTPWYDYNSYVKYVSLSDGLTSIGEWAFYDCSGLTSVTIPNSVTSIGNYAFQGCTGLTSVTIDNSVTSIGKEAFERCYGLTSVTIPNSVTSIGDYAFSDCNVLTSINVASDNSNYCSVDGVLFNKDKTTLIQYPEGKQGAYTIPNSVTSIGERAFYYCSGLTSIEIPNSVTSIGSSAFALCSGLTSIEIPNSVTSIGERAFYYYSGLTSVTIGNSVTSIGSSAFEGCTGLTSVTIPNSVTSIGDYAFGSCISLTSLSVEAGNTVYDSRNNCNAIINTSTNTLIFGCQNTTIPNSVTSIENYAFHYCIGLTSVTIPNSVTSIGNSAFSRCTGLTSVTNYATTPQGISSNVFNSVNKSTCTLYVPAESVAAYKAADVWKDFENIVGVDVPGEDPVVTIPGDYSIYYVDKESQELSDEVVTLHVPVAPVITGFTFLRWETVAADIKLGITIQAVYQADIPSSAPAVYTNPANPAQKLIRNENVYILTEDKTYTITGQMVK